MAIDELPPPNFQTLAEPPLLLVVCQIIHDEVEGLMESDRVATIAEDLADEFPKYQNIEVVEVSLRIGDVGQVHEPQNLIRGWQLSSADDTQKLVFQDKSFAFESQSYSTWENFTGVLKSALQSFQKVYSSKEINRIGLRFIDDVRSETKVPADWNGKIAEKILGLASDPKIGRFVVNCQQIIELSFSNSVQAVIRHGSMRDQLTSRPFYMFDIDVSKSFRSGFDLEKIFEHLDDMHCTQLQLFQFFLTPDYFDTLLSGKV